MSRPPTNDLAARIRALGDMNVPDLQRRFEDVCGRPTRSGNRPHLTDKIVRAWCEARPPQGRNARRAVERALHTALQRRRSARGRPREARLPPVGSTLRRRYRGREVEVRVARDGFVHDGRKYASLSAVARHVTGAHWNGLLFFGLTLRKRVAPSTQRKP